MEKRTVWLDKNPLTIWMRENNIGQTHLASMILVSRQTVYAWMTGTCDVGTKHEQRLAFITKDQKMAEKMAQWRMCAPGMEE
jgi:DNA-binding XRE family transcriptional regulator